MLQITFKTNFWIYFMKTYMCNLLTLVVALPPKIKEIIIEKTIDYHKDSDECNTKWKVWSLLKIQKFRKPVYKK